MTLEGRKKIRNIYIYLWWCHVIVIACELDNTRTHIYVYIDVCVCVCVLYVKLLLLNNLWDHLVDVSEGIILIACHLNCGCCLTCTSTEVAAIRNLLC